MLSFDIFCRVIDHYGDAGVCWRLARNLAGAPYHARVRLWIDEPQLIAALRPRNTNHHSCAQPKVQHITYGSAQQDTKRTANNSRPETTQTAIEICHWRPHTKQNWPSPHQVVIEAFAAGIPEAIQKQLQKQNIWLVLEHLSAEAWVDDFHGLPNRPRPHPQQAFFYYPGFTTHTGGLLREPQLLGRIKRWQQQSRPQQWQQLAAPLGLNKEQLWQLARPETQVFFIFQYPEAPVRQLVEHLAQRPEPAILFYAADQSRAWPHPPINNGSLGIHRLPFVQQDIFDRILWSADFNFVRGEDSWLRALWAQRPFVWQPYQQSKQTHLIKLQAWLDLLHLPHAARCLQLQWNRAQNTIDFGALQPQIAKIWQQQLQSFVHRLAHQPPLAEQLIDFCAQQYKHRLAYKT